MNPIVGPATALAEFRNDHFNPKALFENDRIKVILAAFESGQQIPLHAPDVDLTLAVLEGVGEVMAGDRVYQVRAGDIAVIPAGTTRGVRALGGRLLVLHVVSPPPTAADHARVAAGAAWPAAQPASMEVADLVAQEHAEILSHIEHMRTLAFKAETISEDDLRQSLRDVLAFLHTALLPHAQMEDEVLYPTIDRLLRAVGRPTATMSIDHRAIAALAEELNRIDGPLSASTRRQIAMTLGALETLLRVHFSKEEEVYSPLLARLGREESADLAARLRAESTATVQHRHP